MKTREAMALATLEWAAWFNLHRLLEVIGDIHRPEPRPTTIGNAPRPTPWWPHLNQTASTEPGTIYHSLRRGRSPDCDGNDTVTRVPCPSSLSLTDGTSVADNVANRRADGLLNEATNIHHRRNGTWPSLHQLAGSRTAWRCVLTRRLEKSFSTHAVTGYPPDLVTVQVI